MELEKLKERANKAFEDRGTLLTLWQSLAENFFPERADFTYSRNLGTEFAADLQTSYPVLARRDLGNSFSSILRPAGEDWFETTVNYEDMIKNDMDAKRWLERASRIQRRAMYDRASLFVRATKEGDHDYAAFGQTVISTQLNRMRDGLLYNCWHLRDCAWYEDAEGKIDFFVRRWKPYASDLGKIFGDKVSRTTADKARNKPFEEVEVYHVVCMKHHYAEDPKMQRFNYVSVFFEVKECHPLEQLNVRTSIYSVPRWQTVSGSQYAYSPASIVAIPDARMIQSMTATLLEAGERHANPPMAAREQVIRGDIGAYAGGITWIDAEYDARLGKPLEILLPDKGNVPIGMDMVMDVRTLITHAFFLNKLQMPAPRGEGTAYEMSQLVAQYIRDALPLFEPMEIEYNGSICENTFDLLLHNGGFGPLSDIPRSLSNSDIRFKFKTPLNEAKDQKKMITLQQSKAMLSLVADVAPQSANDVDWREAFRDALDGASTPPTWIRSKEDADEITGQQVEQAQQQQMLDQVRQGSEVVKNIAPVLSNGPGRGTQA